ncbi:MAG TPA: hypothetical protein PLS49_05145 [Candidatus Woesebacteria bacterium]|nr:hypothetical protein [Candidatus Woesebacteria bacterium]
MPTLYDSEQDDINYIEKQEESDFPPPPTQVKKQSDSENDPIMELEKTAEAADRVLFKTKTIFPFDLFPDELIIDENKIDIISGLFFDSKDVFSIPISNISGVNSSFDLFFGQLRIEAWGLNKNPEPIRFLNKTDAAKARRIISGLILANKNEIDLKSIPEKVVRNKLERIGMAQKQSK